ncbi:MAG: Crp/Fnr family transcriptional regulator [endosymbiont of Galathealinum brachiosum]|uniref:Crp/Fnr family transcriptional regulator n=1 Tax=endosymbiont of Galathealinum brachiosum TaxID=2200906 RepID=A0A370DII3_9GAMM|nr:MAG: Crp/Fnr family transcriptional regulator [endosymbiont of Galathealinum brachiosum]
MHSPNVARIEPVMNQSLEIHNDRQNELKQAYPFLGDVNDPAWVETINNAKKLNVKPHTTMFHGSSACNKFMLILKGTIRIYQIADDGREITLYRVEAGGLCVLSLNSMLQKHAYNAVAKTETDVTALVLSADDFNGAMNGIEKFRNYVLTSLTDRLCETMYLVQDTAFNHLNMRLACMLGGLFERNKGAALKITHQDLAHELGTTREVVSRILKEFEKENCVKLSRGRINLASTEGLKWYSGKNN